MTDKMLKFVKIGQQTPPKREVERRKDDFNEIYDDFIKQKAEEQSSRCSQCGVPFCQVHCPLSNNIPDWLKLTAEGRLQEAYELSQSTNNMPEVCGRICPQDRLCEGNCVIEQSGHGTVTIGSVEKYITDNAWEQGWVKPIQIKYEKNQSVGIIGAGPAGLAAAEQLRISRRRGARRLGKRSTKGDTSKRGFVTMSISIGTSSLWSDIATTSSILSTSRIEFHSWRQAYDEERFPVRPRDKRSRKSSDRVR